MKDRYLGGSQFKHPREAELHILSEYSVPQYSPSVLVPGKNIHKGDKVICPFCSKLSDNIETHGDAYLCSCGVGRQQFGNALYIWKT